VSTRKTLPKRLEKEIYQQFGSRCPFCDEQDVATLQVHHIEPHAVVQEHRTGNLLLTCSNCHQKIGDGRITPKAVCHAKSEAEQGIQRRSVPATPSIHNSMVVMGNNHGMVAHTISVVTDQKSIKLAPPPGTIASDYQKRNYAKYLIDRYHEFKKANVGKGDMKYAVLYASIKREFGATWDHLGSDRFGALVRFLEVRIDGTILGKTRKANGQKNYSSFQEHMQK
jgi:hypothetical protein